ncbi:LOW QUALITY PROTEIN: hypothetical protein ACHAW5_010199 [Stephanodiscus triporus]|uniref:Glyceraldehyde 3-phosphate dehydrogenase NAD(P) binding domain-containing protein n=1 Tax=Stephanodiscus triporus TaxID=2934178 RepID=A0ABD3NDZ7_9STRA
MVTCAVNGFVHVNNLCSCELAAYLIKYDSVHGTWDKNVVVLDDGLGFTVDGKLVTFTRCKDYKEVDWRGQIGHGVHGEVPQGQGALNDYFDVCGVKRIVVSAPVKEAGCLNIVLGCNDQLLTEKSRLITNASCTTNCEGHQGEFRYQAWVHHHRSQRDCHSERQSPMRLVRNAQSPPHLHLYRQFHGHRGDLPQTQGEAQQTRHTRFSLNASLTDCVFEIEKEGGVTVEEVNAALKKASKEGPLKGILGYEVQPLVSTDYTNDAQSLIIDTLSTQVIDKTMVKIYAWYDNECSYSKRMAELCHIVAAKFIAGVEPTFKYN